MDSSAKQRQFTDNHDLDVEAVIALYNSVGWSNYTSHPEIFPQMLSSATHVIAAHDGKDLVGIVRVVGDGVSVAVIQDLLVHPDHQRRGLGGQLLERALAATAQIRQTYITTDDADDNRHVVEFYEKHGFKRSGGGDFVTLGLFR